MAALTSATGTGAVPRRDVGTEASKAFSSVDTDQFLQLMIAELQNQDPLDPTDSSEFLQQITQIREIAASDKLTTTLDRVLDGQNLSMAAGLIGRDVEAVGLDGQTIRGAVDRVAMESTQDGGRELRVYVGDKGFTLDRIRQIQSGS